MKECKICLINDKIPGINFVDNTCNICLNFFKKINNYNFSQLQEKKNLIFLKKEILKKKTNSQYDCIIGVSGGLDSTYTAYLAHEIGLKALLVTVDNGWNNIYSYNNISKLLDYTNFDLHSVHLNWEVFKKMQKKLLLKSYPDIEILTDHFIFSNLLRVADNKKISIIINGINFRSEHSNLKSIGWNKRDGTHIKNVLEDINGKNELEFFPYYKFIFLSKFKNIIEIPILNYINYNPHEAKIDLEKKIGFKKYTNKHYESSFTKFFQGYFLTKKFDFDKRILHLSSDIRNKYYTKEQAIKELNKPPLSKDEEIDLIGFIKKKLNLSNQEFDIIMKKQKFNNKKYKLDLLNILLNCIIKIYKSRNIFSQILHLNNNSNLNHFSSISFIEKTKKFGGPGTFQNNLVKTLEQENFNIRYKFENIKTDYFMIISSSLKNIFWIMKMKIKGSKMIHRIDGAKWQYKYKGDIKEKIISFLQNKCIFLTQFLADKIIYQSNYVKNLWTHDHLKNKSVVIYNGAEKNFTLRNFSEDERPTLISIEGNLCSAFNSLELIKCFKDYEFEIYGEIDQDTYLEQLSKYKNVKIKGIVSREKIKEILGKNKKYIFVSLEIRAACPNSVIEALNFGIPVLGYNSGSMNEIIDEKYGKLIDIDKNFKINPIDAQNKLKDIDKNYKSMNQNLKNLDQKFTLEFMSKKYLNEIINT